MAGTHSAKSGSKRKAFAREVTALSRKYGFWFNDEPSAAAIDAADTRLLKYAFDKDGKLILAGPGAKS
jgi:hypothetical protein